MTFLGYVFLSWLTRYLEHWFGRDVPCKFWG